MSRLHITRTTAHVPAIAGMPASFSPSLADKDQKQADRNQKQPSLTPTPELRVAFESAKSIRMEGRANHYIHADAPPPRETYPVICNSEQDSKAPLHYSVNAQFQNLLLDLRRKLPAFFEKGESLPKRGLIGISTEKSGGLATLRITVVPPSEINRTSSKYRGAPGTFVVTVAVTARESAIAGITDILNAPTPKDMAHQMRGALRGLLDAPPDGKTAQSVLLLCDGIFGPIASLKMTPRSVIIPWKVIDSDGRDKAIGSFIISNLNYPKWQSDLKNYIATTPIL